MLDTIIVGTAVVLSLIYFVIKIVKFFRRPAGSSGCSCSSSSCSNCPMAGKNTGSNCCI